MFDKSSPAYQELLKQLSKERRKAAWVFVAIGVFFALFWGWMASMFIAEGDFSNSMVVFIVVFFLVGVGIFGVAWYFWVVAKEPERDGGVKFLLKSYASLAWIYPHTLNTYHYGVKTATIESLFLCDYNRKKVKLQVPKALQGELIELLRQYSPRAVVGYIQQAEDVYHKNPKGLWDWVEGLRRSN